jgi:hypothetical protein
VSVFWGIAENWCLFPGLPCVVEALLIYVQLELDIELTTSLAASTDGGLLRLALA